MPFSFIEIEAKKSRSIIFLFLTLVIFYFISAFLIYTGFRLETLIKGLPAGNNSAAGLYSVQTVLIIFAAALLIALTHWVFSTRNMIQRLLSVIGAKPIDSGDRYHLLYKNIVEELSVATGGRVIEPYVVNSRYLNAFAIQDFNGRSIIGITEGLLTKMNRRQIEAVVAHEAGHLVWGDCLTATICCSVAAVYSGVLKMFTSGWKGEGSVLYRRRASVSGGVLFAVIVIGIMRFLTLILNTWISRERELRADATSVRLTRDPVSLAEALYLISNGWRGNFLPAEEISPIFIVTPRMRSVDESAGFFADLFATHPPIRKRIDILLDMGHANYESLQSGVKEKPRTQEEIPIASPENEKIWYAMNKDKWYGPFDLAGLSCLQWLDPSTWVTRENDKRVMPAHEYKEINKALKNGVPESLSIQTCPACGHGLERIYYEGVPIWRCTHCSGRLAKQDHLLRIITREEMGFSENIKEQAERIHSLSLEQKGKYVEEPLSLIKCPGCGNKMQRTVYNAILPYRLEIDICHVCSLFWFDRNELEIIQYLIEGGNA